MAIGLERLRIRTGSVVHNAAAILLTAFAGLAAIFGLLGLENPMLWPLDVGGRYINLLLLAYALPAVLALLLFWLALPLAAMLGKALEAKRFRKSYLAIVAGAPEPKGGMIDSPLRRESIGREAYMRVCEPDHPDAETARSRTPRRAQVSSTACGSPAPL